MTKNMGMTDRSIRALFAIVVAALWLSGMISGALALVLGIVAGILLATAAVGTCPLYMPFGISTRPRTPHTT